MSLSKLSKLPPEVLSSVVNNQAIPLRHRLRLRLISNCWADIIEDALKKVTSLVIHDEEAANYYRGREPDYLGIRSTDRTDAFTRPLSRLFPSLTQLSIYFGVNASWNAVSSFLAHLDSTKLTTVKLYGYCVDYEFTGPIARALAALPALTWLTLGGHQLLDHLLPSLKPVLSRLEAFGCVHYSPDLPSILSSSLSPRCTHLCLDSHDFQSLNSPFLVELSSNLTHLHLLYCETATIWPFISQMHSLSSLTLNFIDYPLQPHLDSSLLSRFVPFTRLTQLKLFGLDYGAPLALPSKKGTPLSSIKCLTLGIDFGDSPIDYPAFFSAISAWFPNLGKLTVITEQDDLPTFEANLGNLSFSVEIGDRHSVNIWSADW